MKKQKHFIIFRRTDNHCATWLVRADSLQDACVRYALEQGAELTEDGKIADADGYGERILYDHPLAYIESEEKAYAGGTSWNGWEIHELQEKHWEADFTEVFCSESPPDVEEYIERCRPLFRQSYPRSRARGFVWYLKEGPLVTFYRPMKSGRRTPVEILGRYLLPWNEYPEVSEWSGDYDDILTQLVTETTIS